MAPGVKLHCFVIASAPLNYDARMEDETLLAEIAANPADDALRLVYADRLIDRGDPRGEFIQLQVRAKRGYDKAIEARLAALRPHEMAWKNAAGFVGTLTTFDRGFPMNVIGNARAIIASRRALATQPIESMSVLSDLEGLPALCQLPELKRLRSLTISATMGSYGRPIALEPDRVRAVAECDHFGSLRELMIQKGALTETTATILSKAAWLPSLEVLLIPDNQVGRGWVELLGRVRDVKRIWLEGSDVGSAGVQALARSKAHQLDELQLSNTSLQGGLLALAESPVLATVTKLELDRAGVRDAGAIALANASSSAVLKKLSVKHDLLGPKAARALGASTAMRALEELDLRGNVLGKEGVQAFAEGAGLPALRKLGLTETNVGTGRYATYESGSEAAGDFYAGSYEVMESAAELARRLPNRPGLVVF